MSVFTADQERRIMEILDARLKSLQHEAQDHIDNALAVRKLKTDGATAAQVLTVGADGVAAWA